MTGSSDLPCYLVLSYLAIAVAAAIWYVMATPKKMGERRKKASWRTRCLRLAIMLLLPWLPFARVELQTRLWGKSLAPGVHDAMRYQGDRYYASIVGQKLCFLKVLSITPRSAQVYFVTYRRSARNDWAALQKLKVVPDRDFGHSGFVIVLHRTKTGSWKWRGDGFAPFWTDMGNANAGPFPPYPARADFD